MKSVNYKAGMKVADKWENIMHNYENLQIYGPVPRVYGIPGVGLGRLARKTNTARTLGRGDRCVSRQT